jgi:hypothetical protein
VIGNSPEFKKLLVRFLERLAPGSGGGSPGRCHIDPFSARAGTRRVALARGALASAINVTNAQDIRNAEA